jgi:hypothetical protein
MYKGYKEKKVENIIQAIELTYSFCSLLVIDDEQHLALIEKRAIKGEVK